MRCFAAEYSGVVGRTVAILVDSFSIAARCLRFPLGLTPRMARRTIFEGKCVGRKQTRGARLQHTHTQKSIRAVARATLFTTCCVVWPQAHNANHMLGLFAVSIMDFARLLLLFVARRLLRIPFFRLGGVRVVPQLAVCEPIALCGRDLGLARV